jgi:hypothetical protein
MDASLSPSPLALLAGLAHDNPITVAPIAPRPVYKAPENALMHPPNLSQSTTRRTLHLRRSWLTALPLTAGAVSGSEDVNLSFGSEGRFLEGKLDLVVQVGSWLWRTSSGFGGTREESVEDVSQAEGIGKAFEAPSSPHMAEVVIIGPFLGITQDLVGLVDLLESV